MTQAIVGSRVQEMFGTIAGRYDLTNTVLSFGIHHWWRRSLTARISGQRRERALDVCTGTGDLLTPLARRFGQVVGADFCLPMLKAGRSRAAAGEALSVLQGDAMALPFADCAFDLVTVSFGIRNVENVRAGLTEMARVLRPGGQLLVLEFGQPESGVFGALYRFYSKYIMPAIGGLLTGNREAYTYLPETASAFPCRDEFTALLRQSGFAAAEYRALTGGIAYLYDAHRSAEVPR